MTSSRLKLSLRLTTEQQAGLRALIEEHVSVAHSKLGERLLADWSDVSANFILFTPKPQA